MNIIDELLAEERDGGLTKDVIDRFYHLSTTLSGKQISFGRAIINRAPLWTPTSITVDDNEILWVVINEFGQVETNPLPKSVAETERAGFAADHPTRSYTIVEA